MDDTECGFCQFYRSSGMTLDAMENMDFVVDTILTYNPNRIDNDQPVVQKVRKRLNDLDSKEWVKSIKSVWMEAADRKNMQTIEDAMASGLLLSESPPRDELKKNHPAIFSENDVSKLIKFFTKSGETVLDPFLGSGSSAMASMSEGRNFIGIELYSEWLDIVKQRIANTSNSYDITSNLYCGDSLEVMRTLGTQSVDFIVTSPPYWGILGKNDHKAKGERVAKGLATDYGNQTLGLTNIEDYAEFLKVMVDHFDEYHRLLNPKKYAAVIVSDFRHGQEYYMFHADIATAMKRAGFTIQGLITLVQDNKKLYPYGYPSTYVPNISNQFIIIGRKL